VSRPPATPKPSRVPVRLSAAQILLGEAPPRLSHWIAEGERSEPPADPGLVWAGNAPKTLAKRLEFQFPFSEAEAFDRAAAAIADLTRAEWDQWRETHSLDHLRLFGQERFARSFLSNLLRREPDVRPRAPGVAVKQPALDFDLDDHLIETVRRARTGEPQPTWRHKVRHRVQTKPGAAPEGETIRCWLPFPKPVGQQRNIRLLASSPGHAILAPETSPQRTAYLEGVQTAAGVAFEIEYEFETAPSRYRYLTRLASDAAARDNDPKLYADDLADRSPREPLHPEMRALADGLAGYETQALLKAHRIYRWIAENIHYIAECEYGLLPSLSHKGAETGEGDCGVLAMLFIVLCRCQGVPARWQSGWFLRPGGKGTMHDWAEFHAGPFGWLPCDPTYGLRPSGDPAHRWFYCGGLDGFRMISNTDWGAPLHPAKTHERSEPVDFQRGEVEWRGGNLFFDQWDYEVAWESEKQ
jgi:hypothetical protein